MKHKKQQQRFLWKRLAVLTSLLLMAFGSAWAQTGISYPSPSESLERGYGDGLLTVKLSFSSNCNNGEALVTVNLGAVNNPGQVTYLANSITTLNGSSGISIAEENISDLSNPVFKVTGIGVGSEIVFTLRRKISCGVGASSKDVVTVTGGDCSATEDDINVNNYVIKSAAFTLTPPASITNAVLNQTATRSFTLTNGGNGRVDTAFLYIVYPGGGVENTNNNKITVGTTDFSPVAISGDSLFYKIFGPTIFGGDDVFDNSESITIEEPIIIKRCGTSTNYGASKAVVGYSDVDLVVNKLEAGLVNISVVSGNTPNSTTTYVVTVGNTKSEPIAANELMLAFYCGSSPTPFDYATFPNSIPGNTNATENVTVSIPGNLHCWPDSTVRVVLSTDTNCLCSPSEMLLGQPLPITLLNFNVYKQNQEALLIWSSSREENAKGYEVERSVDGDHWQSLGFVGVKMEGGADGNYDFVDNNPKQGLNVYRLRMVDLTGHSTYSEMRSLDFGQRGNIQLFPNPVSSDLTITGLRKHQELMIINTLGQKVKTVEVLSDNRMNINVDYLPAGQYQVVVMSEQGVVQTLKFVKH